MSSNERSRPRLAVTSRYSASIIASRSPSRAIATPVVVLMVRILSPEAPDGRWLVSMDFDEILGAGQCQHGFDSPLYARQLQAPAGGIDLAVEIHQAANRGAVDVSDRPEVDQNVPPAGGN